VSRCALVRLPVALPVGSVSASSAGADGCCRRAGRPPDRRWLSPGFVADACVDFDSGARGDLIRHDSRRSRVEVARELLRRGDVITMGRFVEFFSDDTIRPVQAAIEDDGNCFASPSSSTLETVSTTSSGRGRRAHRATFASSATQRSRDLWTETLALGHPRELRAPSRARRARGGARRSGADGIRGGCAGKGALGRHPTGGRVDVGSEPAKAGQLRALRDPGVLEASFAPPTKTTTGASSCRWCGSWTDDCGPSSARSALGCRVLRWSAPADAALMGEQWEALLDIVGRLPSAKQKEFADVVARYIEVDATSGPGSPPGPRCTGSASTSYLGGSADEWSRIGRERGERVLVARGRSARRVGASRTCGCPGAACGCRGRALGRLAHRRVAGERRRAQQDLAQFRAASRSLPFEQGEWVGLPTPVPARADVASVLTLQAMIARAPALHELGRRLSTSAPSHKSSPSTQSAARGPAGHAGPTQVASGPRSCTALAPLVRLLDTTEVRASEILDRSGRRPLPRGGRETFARGMSDTLARCSLQ